MERITMQNVLAFINQYDADGEAREFSLQYVKDDGSVGFKARARKGGKFKAKSEGKSTFHYNLKSKGLLQIVDLETNEVRNITLALITHFNGIRVWH